MDPMSIAALVGAGGQLAGGLSGLLGGQSGGTPEWASRLAQDNFNRNIQLQKDFAQQGIQWRVKDAEAAGIHPLFALGGAGASFSPVPSTIGDTQGPQSRGLGGDLERMGSGLSRAIAATQSKEDRAAAAGGSAIQALGLERAGLENELLRARIQSEYSRMNAGQIGPPMPTGAALTVPNRGTYEAKPHEVNTARPDGTGSTAAGPPAPQNTWRRTPTGGVYATPGPGMNIDEFSSPGFMPYQLHNNALPYISGHYRDAARPPNSELPPGAISWRLGAPGMGWLPVYPEIPNRDLRGHYPAWQRHTGPRGSTYRFSPSGAER